MNSFSLLNSLMISSSESQTIDSQSKINFKQALIKNLDSLISLLRQSDDDLIVKRLSTKVKIVNVFWKRRSEES